MAFGYLDLQSAFPPFWLPLLVHGLCLILLVFGLVLFVLLYLVLLIFCSSCSSSSPSPSIFPLFSLLCTAFTVRMYGKLTILYNVLASLLTC